jgi:hypothetical protein
MSTGSCRGRGPLLDAINWSQVREDAAGRPSTRMVYRRPGYSTRVTSTFSSRELQCKYNGFYQRTENKYIYFAKICQNLMSSKYFHKNGTFSLHVADKFYLFCNKLQEK